MARQHLMSISLEVIAEMDAKTVTDARSFLRSMRAAIAFAETVEEIGSTEDAVAILKRDYETLSNEIGEQRAILLELGEQQKAAESEIEAAKAEGRKVAKDMKAKTELAFTAKMKDATEVSEAMVAKAKDEASAWDHRTMVAKKEFEQAKAELAILQTKLAETKIQLEALFAGVK